MSTRLHFHLFSWLFLALISAKPLHSEVSIKASVCNERDFEKGGPFDEILNRTLSCLLRVTALRKLNFCIERNTQTAYGFSQCRGDLRPGDCSHCIRVARDTALSDCEGKSMGRVYGDKCLLFYQDSEFSGDDFEEPVQGPECSEERSKDPTRFAAGVGGLVASLSVEAQRTEGFATGSEWVGGVSGKVFGVAQCWGVMGDKCGSCLSKARVALSGICRTSVEGVVAFDGCYLRYQNYPFSSSDRMLAPHSPESSPVDGRQQPSVPLKISSSRKFTLFFFLGCLILVVIIVLLLIIGWKFIKHAKLRKNTDSETTRSAPNFFFSGNLRTISYFDYRTLRKATSNFHLGNKLGSGGFGPVYQGVLDDGRIIAVKKLALEKSQQGEAEFLAEVRLITSIQHKNLLRLLGCCSDGPERLLVYEYMKNKSLDLIVYGKRGKFLNWQTRFQIILGIARGLQYLHEDSHIRIVHRDIKASNILLDEKFQPRIGDFGLARFFPEDQAYLSTKFAGTLGYTAPEYAIRGELSEKADIYSFGVLVLEIVSCRKNTDLTLPSEMQYLPEYAWRMYEKSRVVDLMDPELRVDGLVERDILCVIKVAFLCLQSNPNQRPPMSEIVAMLTCKPEMTGSPRKPVFFNHRHRTDEKIYWDTISQASSSPLPSDSPSLVDPISHRCTNN